MNEASAAATQPRRTLEGFIRREYRAEPGGETLG
jgi:hypothetical protein